VTGTRPHGASGAVADYFGVGDIYAAASNNRFVDNHYYVSDLSSGAFWQWDDKYITFEVFQSRGLDTTGTVNLNFSPQQFAQLKALGSDPASGQ